jgi:hypothetical protein
MYAQGSYFEGNWVSVVIFCTITVQYRHSWNYLTAHEWVKVEWDRLCSVDPSLGDTKGCRIYHNTNIKTEFIYRYSSYLSFMNIYSCIDIHKA